MCSRTDTLAITAVSPFAVTIITAYLLDALGVGIAPHASVGIAVGFALTVAWLGRRTPVERTTLALFVAVVATVLGVLVGIAWPSLLPPGSGPDLTHHLALVDYIQRHGALVHDPMASHQLGEMAHYTPGLHLLTGIIATLFDTDGLYTIYPLIAASVALKCGIFALLLIRLTPQADLRLPVAITGMALLLHGEPFTIDSFARDSFLAQVLSELFAVVMLWSLIVWIARASWVPMAVFGVAGAASFLTWPLWIGPLLIALAVTVVPSRLPSVRTRATHLAISLIPIAIVAGLHSAGRTGAARIVGTSGAVAPPSLEQIGWWFAALAVSGLVIAAWHQLYRPVLGLAAGLVGQGAALLAIANAAGAATPYMAIKMAYLAIYPAVAAVLLAAVFMTRGRAAWGLAILSMGLAVSNSAITNRPAPVVATDLYDAGMWARAHLPQECVDYLVRNEYTAYWLHVAVLGNARLSERSRDDSVYLTEPAFARWIEDGPPPYAIARTSLLPMEIRNRTRVRYESGDAVVLERLNSRPGAAGDTCVGSPRTTPP